MRDGGMRMFLLGALATGAGMVVACALLFVIINVFQMFQPTSVDVNATKTVEAQVILIKFIQSQTADAARHTSTSAPPPTTTSAPSPTLPPTATVPPTATMPPPTATPAPPPPTVTPTPTLPPTATATRVPPPPATPTFPVNWLSGFNARELSRRQAQIDVDYFYNGQWGTDNVMIAALGISGSDAQVFEVNSSSHPVNPGNGHATLTLEIGAPGEWHTTKVEVCIYEKGSSVPHDYCQKFPFSKVWWMATPRP